VAPDDGLSDREDLVRAAEAVASWARARRATWTGTPAGAVTTDPGTDPGTFFPGPQTDDEFTPAPARSAFPLVPEPSEPFEPSEPGESQPSLAERIGAAVRSFRLPSSPWLVRGALAAALGFAAFVGIPYLWNALPAFSSRAPGSAAKPSETRTPPVKPTEARPPAGGRKGTGGLVVKTSPAGARVLVDGKARGVTPLTLTDLSAGSHEVALESNAGTIHRTVTVAANETAEIDESIFSGWVAVYAPFEVAISENGRVLRADERNQFLLPPGTHQIRLTNKSLAYDSVQQVEVKPGETIALRLTPNPSTLTVTASEAAEVWLDGARVGDTPLSALPVPLGTHDLVVKRVTGGERRFPITIGANPFSLHVEFQ
jgi:PEGA domain-containing protein